MAISRAQMLKEATPRGLNALFGLEYEKYEDEHTLIYDTESSDRSFEEEVKLSGFGAAPVSKKVLLSTYDAAQESFTARYNHETIAMGFCYNLKKLWKIIFMILFLLVIQNLWHGQWLTPSKLSLLIPLNNGFHLNSIPIG